MNDDTETNKIIKRINELVRRHRHHGRGKNEKIH